MQYKKYNNSTRKEKRQQRRLMSSQIFGISLLLGICNPTDNTDMDTSNGDQVQTDSQKVNASSKTLSIDPRKVGTKGREKRRGRQWIIYIYIYILYTHTHTHIHGSMLSCACACMHYTHHHSHTHTHTHTCTCTNYNRSQMIHAFLPCWWWDVESETCHAPVRSQNKKTIKRVKYCISISDRRLNSV